jgi:hypothetical protein
MRPRLLTLHQEIREAIAARERLVLVVEPRAYPLVPDELRLFHGENFRDVYALMGTSTISPGSCPNHRRPPSNGHGPPGPMFLERGES